MREPQLQEISNLVGLQLQILSFLADNCIERKSNETSRLSLRAIAEAVGVTVGSCNTSVHRLKQKRLIRTQISKQSRGGWSIYYISQDVIDELLRLNVEDSFPAKDSNGLVGEINFFQIIGIKRALLEFLIPLCQKSLDGSSGPVTIEQLKAVTGTSAKTIKTTIYRLKRDGLLYSAGSQRGNSGWTRFKIPKTVVEAYRSSGLSPSQLHLAKIEQSAPVAAGVSVSSLSTPHAAILLTIQESVVDNNTSSPLSPAAIATRTSIDLAEVKAGLGQMRLNGLLRPLSDEDVLPEGTLHRLTEPGAAAVVELLRQGDLAAKATNKSSPGIRSKVDQLPKTFEESALVAHLIARFNASKDYFGFEPVAAELLKRSDSNVIDISVTKKTGDGGRDGIGRYRVGRTREQEFAMEAKCYDGTPVGVKDTMRLASRLGRMNLGFLVTTSYVAERAQRELLEDGHIVEIIAGGDIALILIDSGIRTPEELDRWIDSLPKQLRLGA